MQKDLKGKKGNSLENAIVIDAQELLQVLLRSTITLISYVATWILASDQLNRTSS